MNTNSITKFFTAVSFFVVSVLGTPGFAGPTTTVAPAYPGYVDPARQSEVKRNEAIAACKDSALLKEYGSLDKCLRCEMNPSSRGCSSDGDSSSCNEAFKKYTENSADSVAACESLVGSSSSSDRRKGCTERINSCAKMAQQTSSQTAQEDGGLASTINIFRDMVSDDPLSNIGGGSGCLVDFDSKEAREAEKEFRDRKRELEKEKKDIEDQAIKDKEEYDKDLTSINKKIEELEIANKKLLAEIDTESREKNYATTKETMESAKRLKDLSKKNAELSAKLRSEQFAYSERMMSATADKQNQRCKSALDAAKTCMIKAVKGAIDPKDESCKGFPLVIRSKGPKATAELKAQLQQVATACYEKEAADKRQAEFGQQEKLAALGREMTTNQEQIQQENEAQAAQADNAQKIQQESERKKEEAKAALAQQIATLRSEMVQFGEKLQAKTYRSKERLEKLAKDLQMLELEQKTGKRSTTRMAANAVRKTNSDIQTVISECDCKEDIYGAKTGQEANSTATANGRKKCAQLKLSLPSRDSGTGSSRRSSTSGAL